MKTKIIALLILLGHTLVIISQDFTYRYFDLNDGIGDRVIWDCTFDEKGYLWIGTDNGLNRFNGYNFIAVNDQASSYLTTKGRLVRNIHKLSDNKLLVNYINNDIADVLDLAQRNCVTIQLVTAENQAISRIKIFQDKIYFLEEKGEKISLYYLNDFNEKTLIIELNKSNWDFLNLDFAKINDTNYLITDSWNNTEIVNTKTGEKQRFSQEKIEANAHWKKVNFIYNLNSSRVLMAYNDRKGIYTYDYNNNSINTYDLLDQDYFYTGIYTDERGNYILTATLDNESLYPDLTKVFLISGQKKKDISKILSFSSAKINSIAGIDFNHKIAIGTHNGLYLAFPSSRSITKHLHKKLTGKLYGNSMRGIVQLGDTLLTAAEINTLYYRTNNSDKFNKLDLFKNMQDSIIDDWSCSNQLIQYQDKIYFQLCDKTNLSRSYLGVFDKNFSHPKKIEIPYNIQAMVLDENAKKIWLACNEGMEKGCLGYFDLDLGKVVFLKNENNPLATVFPRCIIHNSQGELWIGTTDDGIIIYNHENRSSYIISRETGLPSNRVLSLEESRNNYMLAGTSQGLAFISKENKITNVIDRTDGMINDIIAGIVEINDRSIWLSTYYGLSYYDYYTGAIRNFSQTDGLSSNEFNRFSNFYSSDSTIILGTINGLNILNPKELISDRSTINIRLDKVTYYEPGKDSIIEIYPSELAAPIMLPPGSTNLKLYTSLFEWQKVENHRFYAKVENLDPEYLYTGNDRIIQYQKLPAGDHQILIKGADHEGNFTKNNLSVAVSVEDYFYNTSWFRWLVAGVVFGIVYLITYFRGKQKIKIERWRTKMASDMHDEVSGMLSNIASTSEILLLKKEKDLRTLGKLKSQASTAMEQMRDVLWSIDARRDTYGDLLLKIKSYANDLLEDKDIPIQYKIFGIEEEKSLSPKVRENLYFIIKECLSNISKHAHADMVSLEIRKSGNKLYLKIEDNGNAINIPDVQGMGLANITMRVKRLNGNHKMSFVDGFVHEFSIPL